MTINELAIAEEASATAHDALVLAEQTPVRSGSAAAAAEQAESLAEAWNAWVAASTAAAAARAAFYAH